MASDSPPGPSTPPAQRKAAIFATWAKGAAPLIASIGAVVLGLINIYKKPPEVIAVQSYKEISAAIEKLSAETLANHDDNVNLRAWTAGRLGDSIPLTAVAAAPTDAGAAPIRVTPGRDHPRAAGRPGSPGDRPCRARIVPGRRAGPARVLPA